MATSPSEGRGSQIRRRLPLVIALIVGTLVWKGGFGFFATARDVTWRFNVPYGDVRKVELQVWREETLLRREERSFPSGVSEELKQQVVLRSGPHRAVAMVWLKEAADPRVFQKSFDPGGADALVLEPTP